MREPDFSFLQDASLKAVCAALGAGSVRAVGGAVRDVLASRAVGDIDLATTLLPEEVVRRLEGAGLKAVPTGLKHGTITAVANGNPFEITTLRRDIKTDGRHAEVAFTEDWKVDAARRDFTINAMSLSLDGEVHDYFGGREDLGAGRVRFVGEPEQRIREDVLRILRFFRFHAHFGKGAPDEAGLAACKALVGLLPQLSYERVRNELLKLFKAPDPAPTLRLMAEAGVFKALELPLGNAARLEKVVAYERDLERVEPIRRLWAAAEDVDISLAEKLRLSRAEASRLLAIAPLPLPTDLPGLKRAAYDLGTQAVVDILVVTGAVSADVLNELEKWKQPAFPLSGKDVEKLGIAPGPRMGELLKAVERWWVCMDFTPSKEACFAEAKKLASDSSPYGVGRG